MYNNMQRRSQGLSLVDMITTLAVAGILLSIAIPGFSQFISYNRAATTINQITGSIHLARSEAVRRGMTVSLCPNVNNSCGSQTNWGRGILVFADKNSDGNMDSDDSLIRVLDSFVPTAQVSWRAWPTSRYLRFDSRGFMVNQNGSFTYCPADKNLYYARQIIISRTGRPRLARDSDQNGIVEDSQGQDVTCN